MKFSKILPVAILKQKCPRCREGNMFVEKNPYKLKGLTRMPERCGVCGQPFELEPGFYYGAMYVSYALCVGIFILNFFWLRFFIDYKGPNSVILFSVINSLILIVLMPLIFRIARVTYLSLFVKYNKEARQNKKAHTSNN